MGKFDLDDLLNDFDGPGDENKESPAAEDVSTDAPASPQQQEADAGAAHHASSAPKPFVRNNPEETPRPPDFSVRASGLGSESSNNTHVENADPTRCKPEDGLRDVYRPEKSEPSSNADLIALLVERDVMSAEENENARRVLKQSPGRRVADVLIEMGVDEAEVQVGVAEINNMSFERTTTEAGEEAFDQKAMHRLTPEFCKESLVLPLRVTGGRLVIGTTQPDDVFLLDDIKRRLGQHSVKHVLLTRSDILAVIDQLTQDESGEFDVDEILADVEEDDVEVVREDDDDADADDADSSPVVRYVNHIISTALKEGASDIHIEPEEKTMKVRFRIDGILFEMMNPPRKMHASLTSRIKIMANLDIAERRLPQDGRIRATVLGRKLDLRVSTVPTPKGEKTVMRILDNRSIQVTLDELGFSDDTLTIWKNQIAQPHGIILVTGPTGSGKTTTLYSSIRQMDLQKLNVSTVEDPVEYNLANITQIQTHERIGMTFAKALKALLRQDPDVVMVGEIRDMETATTAIQAALTGHLVLSTLHTNDAPSSITRLINIGVESFLVGAAVNSVLAQRLVRRICKHCKAPQEVKPEIEDFLTMHGVQTSEVMYGAGCDKCRQTGYAGRQGLYELLVLDDFLRDAVARQPSVTEFRRLCKERGMISLREDGFRKVGLGITTTEEILRVTESTI